jgi:hypothetical protein
MGSRDAPAQLLRRLAIQVYGHPRRALARRHRRGGGRIVQRELDPGISQLGRHGHLIARPA